MEKTIEQLQQEMSETLKEWSTERDVKKMQELTQKAVDINKEIKLRKEKGEK